MNFSIDYMFSLFPFLFRYIPITLLMAVLTMFFSIILGLALAAILKSKVPVIYQFSKVYVSFFRGTPVLVQLFIIYFGLPQLYSGFTMLNAFTCVVIGLSLNNSAYLAEIFRAALDSVDKGQLEACLSVGMTKAQAYRRVILPQAARNAVPATGNMFIGVIKETSLAFTVGITELLAEAKLQASNSLRFFEAYFAVAIIYWIITILYGWIQGMLERKLDKPYSN